MRTDKSLYSIFYIKSEDKFVYYSNPEFAYAYYLNKRLNLIDGSIEQIGIKSFQNNIKDIDPQKESSNSLFINLHYEYSFYEDADKNDLLATEIKFRDSEYIELNQVYGSLDCTEFKHIAKEDYIKQFDQIYENLLDGNSYQCNLTNQFKFKFKNTTPEFLISKLWSKKENIGEYAHCFYSSILNKLFLSNSPECLFEIKNDQIISKPIKGTIQITSSEKNAWNDLKNSKKDQAELYMITDLIRNDLTKIQMIPSRVKSLKAKLVVPSIVHQYSEVRVDIESGLKLINIIDSMFPGGSITGAPKKSSVKILKGIEHSARGFYCGSTILLNNKVKAASINIRSAVFDFSVSEFTYGSGGAITLLSESNEEYKECLLKMKSFIQILS